MMHERIKELAVQSGLIARYGSDREGLSDFDYRMFAELIIMECYAVIQQQVSLKYKNGSDDEFDDFMAGYYTASRDARTLIKLHFFGVE